MRKTFTVAAGSGTVNVEAATSVEAIDIAMGRGTKDIYSVKGPRFTDSLRTKPHKRTDSEAAGKVLYLGTREAVRHLDRL